MILRKDANIHRWILENRIINEKRIPINFKDHLFLFDPYMDFSPDIVIKKSAQVGASVMQVLKSFYLAKLHKTNTIYTLPTDSDVKEFVTTKVDKIIQMNPTLAKMLQKDTVHLKELEDTFVYYKGTISKTAAIMTTAELLNHDELDRSDQTVISGFQSRTIGFKGAEEVFTGRWTFSNPSVVNSGVDLEWKKSDQKEWFIKCKKCEAEQILKWDKNIDHLKGIFICSNCGKELTKQERRVGRWVSQKPGNRISGYHISQMMAPWMTAKDLLKEEENMTPDVFQNFVLGEPISMGEADNFRRLIVDCWTPKAIDKAPYILGVDVGRIKHWVLGSPEGIFKVGRCESREDLESIIDKYNPITVMDAGPERTWAEEFRKKYPKLHICFFQRDKKKKILIKWGEKKDTGIVHVDRNRAIDAVIRDFVYGEILFDLDARHLDAYIKHWDVMVKKREETPLGTGVYVWDTNQENAPNHWAMATVYWWVAKQRAQKAIYDPSKAKKTAFVHQKAHGEFAMQDLKDNFDEYVKK